MELNEHELGTIKDDQGIEYAVGPIYKCKRGELHEMIISSNPKLSFDDLRTEVRNIRGSGGNIYLAYNPEIDNYVVASAGFHMIKGRPFLRTFHTDDSFKDLGIEKSLIDYVSEKANNKTENNGLFAVVPNKHIEMYENLGFKIQNGYKTVSIMKKE